MAKKLKIRKPLLTIDAHYRVIISAVIAAIVCASIFNPLSTPSIILITWMSFALSATTMDWIIFFTANPKTFRENYKLEDSSRTMIFILVIAAALISLFAILFLLKSSKGESQADVTGHVIVAITSVVVSWCMVHTIFALRYAHLYYDTDGDDCEVKPVGGLEFPGDEKEPDYLDFAYFSFVIGMTFQVSDVEISDKQIRRLVLIHGLISFAFNTAIVALSINVISGLVAH